MSKDIWGRTVIYFYSRFLAVPSALVAPRLPCLTAVGNQSRFWSWSLITTPVRMGDLLKMSLATCNEVFFMFKLACWYFWEDLRMGKPNNPPNLFNINITIYYKKTLFRLDSVRLMWEGLLCMDRAQRRSVSRPSSKRLQLRNVCPSHRCPVWVIETQSLPQVGDVLMTLQIQYLFTLQINV